MSQHTDNSNNTKAWAVPQHTDTSNNTKAILKCSYARHSYLGTIFSHDKLLLNGIHSPEMEINPPKTACGCPGGRAIKIKIIIIITHWRLFHTEECFCQCTNAYPGDPLESSARERCNNSIIGGSCRPQV